MSTPRAVLLPLLSVLLVLPSAADAQRRPALPDGVLHRTVDIWSKGTRMAGDLYRPARTDDRLPAIIMSHGWGGTKAGLTRNAMRLAAGGYVVLAFDYCGWGESDGKLVGGGERSSSTDTGPASWPSPAPGRTAPAPSTA